MANVNRKLRIGRDHMRHMADTLSNRVADIQNAIEHVADTFSEFVFSAFQQQRTERLYESEDEGCQQDELHIAASGSQQDEPHIAALSAEASSNEDDTSNTDQSTADETTDGDISSTRASSIAASSACRQHSRASSDAETSTSRQSSRLKRTLKKRTLNNYEKATWREWFTHHVLIGKDANGQVVIAQNEHSCNCECIFSEHWADEVSSRISKIDAGTNAIVCEFSSKQNIGQSGCKIKVMAVHCLRYSTKEGTKRTKDIHEYIKYMHSTRLWWDKIKSCIEKYDVQFLVGDFNCNTEQVVPQLTTRGLNIDFCSLYHWLHSAKDSEGYCLGIKPCEIFYIGGDALCEMQCDSNCIGDILKAAARSSAGPQSLATFGVDKSENKETPQYVNKTPCQVGRSCKSENSKTPNNLFESYKKGRLQAVWQA